MRTTVLAAGSLAVAAAALTFAAPAAAADRFGSSGVIVGVDRLMPLVSYTSSKADDTNGDGGSTSSSNTSIALVTNGLGNLFSAGYYNLPRLGVDVAVIPHLTVGGSLWLYTELSSSVTNDPPNNGTSTTTDQPRYTYWGFAPRVGYVFNVGNTLAIWPRAGIEYHHVDGSSVTVNGNTRPGGSVWLLAADLEALLVITPWKHFGFTVGPTADIPLAGKQSSTTSTTANGTTTTTTHSTDVSVFQVGATVGLLGYF